MFTWCSRAVNCSFPSFFAALRTRSSPFGPLDWLSVQHGLSWSAFSLVNSLPSTTSAGGFPLLFGCFAEYYAAVRLPAAVPVGLIAHRFLPTGPPPFDCGRQRGLPVLAQYGVSRKCMPGVYDSAGLRRARIARAASWPSGFSDTVGSRIEDFGAQYPACICTCQRFKCGLATAPT